MPGSRNEEDEEGMMSRRSRKHKKRFQCGHRGYGQYCHRCTEAQKIGETRQLEKQQMRQQWQQTFLNDRIDLTRLPKKVVLKARQVLSWLNSGISLHQLKAKRFSFDRTTLRIPVTYRYRLLCHQDASGITPLQVISHETYNSIARNTAR